MRVRRRIWMQKLLVAAMAITATVQPALWGTPAIVRAGETLTVVEETPVTAGAVLKKLKWQFDRDQKLVQVNVNVIEVDLQNPYVKLDTIMGTNNQYTKKQGIQGMAQEAGAVAAVNGDFFNMQAEGVPIGPQIRNGKLEATPPYLPGFYSFGLTRNNEPVIDLFTFEGFVKAKDGAQYPLGGINKTYYWFEEDGVHTPGQHSHIDGLFMYTHSWGQVDHSNDGVTVPTEVLVRNGVIERIEINGIIDMVAPEDGYILRASGKATEFVQQHLKVGQRLDVHARVLPRDASKPYDVSTFKTMIGGHTLLVDEGKPSYYTREVKEIDGYKPRSRTAIGYSRDKRYVYLITADRAGDSAGLTLPELQQLMVKLGVWRGMNLDGGGSTQMVARPLGETEVRLVNQTEYGSVRPVVNGIGVFTLAPKGPAKGITVRRPKAILIGEQAAYQIGGYDIYYNPIQPGDVQVAWSASGAGATMNGNVLTGVKPGTVRVKAASGSATAELEVTVLGGKDIESIAITGNLPTLAAGTTFTLPDVKIVTKEGQERKAPPSAIRWEFVGFQGTQQDNQVRVTSVDNPGKACLVASYDGFSTAVSLASGQIKRWVDFDTLKPAVTMKKTPETVTGNVYQANEPGHGNALRLAYDFTAGEGTKALYAVFGGESGLPVEGAPNTMSVSIKGDGSLNWVRAEVADSTGEIKLIDLTRYMDWTDWKTLTVPLHSYDLKFPIQLRKIYVVNPKNGQEGRALKGNAAIDDIAFSYTDGTDASRNRVQLTIGQKNQLVNGQVIAMDQAPVLDSGNTLVPVRFVAEALGARVEWIDHDRSVRIYKGPYFVHLWLDQVRLSVGGKSTIAEAPPRLMNERTMVPLRLIAEAMGWKVGWEQETMTVTLE